ncbi:ImmA/IrrE family metallo-endopeptidase [Candidatus Soleaferrea massiliensis]|uniref:ImmA/IrrE family metallo-endopeptidase n=1 Tax=Candidatus Soleaferrea massiliensis TaxID=1470354 RepID=UPI000590D3DF|nr:ImmA/IrrE family metallo-endopeptidase [Candidatus Soleaferrea massiliensis]
MGYVEQMAQQLKDIYHTKEPRELCECLDILVLPSELPEQVRGFYTNIQNRRIIYLNKRLSALEQRVVCAHELGHALLHTDMNAVFNARCTLFCAARYEHEADLFSAFLLVDPDEYAPELFEDFTAEQIAGQLQLPAELIRLRFERRKDNQPQDV